MCAKLNSTYLQKIIDRNECGQTSTDDSPKDNDANTILSGLLWLKGYSVAIFTDAMLTVQEIEKNPQEYSLIITDSTKISGGYHERLRNKRQ
jgi:hypothetical protein